MANQIARQFTSSFLTQSLAKQIAACDAYELAPLFLEVLHDHQPVLEAGCGSGRWCGWLSNHGIRIDGLDWSSELCHRASIEIPHCRFIACDIRHTPFPDCSY